MIFLNFPLKPPFSSGIFVFRGGEKIELLWVWKSGLYITRTYQDHRRHRILIIIGLSMMIYDYTPTYPINESQLIHILTQHIHTYPTHIYIYIYIIHLQSHISIYFPTWNSHIHPKSLGEDRFWRRIWPGGAGRGLESQDPGHRQGGTSLAWLKRGCWLMVDPLMFDVNTNFVEVIYIYIYFLKNFPNFWFVIGFFGWFGMVNITPISLGCICYVSKVNGSEAMLVTTHIL